MIISFALMQPDNAVFKTLEKITLTVHTLDSSTSPRSLKKLHDQLQRERAHFCVGLLQQKIELWAQKSVLLNQKSSFDTVLASLIALISKSVLFLPRT
jgi:hypothetical protein